MIVAGIFVFPVLVVALWLGKIRPYRIKHHRDFKPGISIGASMWVDWQQAGEVSRTRNDRGIIHCCQAVLALHIAAAACFLGTILMN